MNKNLKKIAIILLLSILLPAVFFAIFEISNLNESEKVIEGIYNNQLDAILFSVNQYTEDVVSGWRNKINNSLTDEGGKLMDAFLELYSSINFIFIADSIADNDISFYRKSNFSGEEEKIAGEILATKKNQIERLFTYQKETGYLKIEPVDIESENSAVFFLLDNGSICGIVFNPENFVRELLGTKIKSISADEFKIVVYNSSNNNLIFSTDNGSTENIQQQKSLWLLPDYNLGIQLKGKTIEDLVKERSLINLILIILLVVILIAGLIFVFRNVKKEVELAQIKSDFVSNVSHELRTPLALISMFAETLEMGRVKKEEKKKEYYSIISQETGRLSRIVNKILSFSQIEAGKRKYSFDKTNLNNVVNNILSTYRFHLENSGFKYIFNDESDLPEIQADKEAVSEAVINLIDNAVKYSREKKEIFISTGFENNSVYIEVRDSGIGIPAEDQKKIFEKFFRVSSGLVHNTKGTGLGLTLVKHIMDAHNGKIVLTSSPGKGSSFKLLFKLNNN